MNIAKYLLYLPLERHDFIIDLLDLGGLFHACLSLSLCPERKSDNRGIKLNLKSRRSFQCIRKSNQAWRVRGNFIRDPCCERVRKLTMPQALFPEFENADTCLILHACKPGNEDQRTKRIGILHFFIFIFKSKEWA